MGKTRGDLPNPKPIDEPVKESPFELMYGSCNQAVCKAFATMLLYDKAMLVDQLYVSSNPDVAPPISSQSNIYPVPGASVYTQPNNPATNVFDHDGIPMGYHIVPNSGTSNIYGNFLKLHPLWEKVDGGQIYQCYDDNSGIKILTNNYIQSTPGGSGVLAKQSWASNINTFNHQIFQFNSQAIYDGFERAFISFYELKSIVDHCDYLAIGGSMVMTGNIRAYEWNDDREAMAFGGCNRGYFTYHLMGLKEVKVNDLHEKWKRKYRRMKTILVPSNIIFKEDEIVINPAIPTETWAVPCPPMWRPG